ncbi:beta strand repeat-containing protein, partial [Rhodospirillum sp. A1_3_36]|uniref:beta strand repeat-containing protein n=1 Tax=Rhodospirillum sp. A1_3_36 TaxID=3391666 RepID=UPI0039A51324
MEVETTGIVPETFTISGIPDGWHLYTSDNTEIPISGGVSVVPANLMDGLYIQALPGTEAQHSAVDFDLTVQVSGADSTGDAVSLSTTVTVEVLPVADSPEFEVSDATQYDGGADVVGDGTENSDVISGSSAGDVIDAKEGDDTIHGWDGDDSIHAGQGNDLVSGGDGNDTVFAGRGEDTVSGGAGDDSIDGQCGDDELWGDTHGPVSVGVELSSLLVDRDGSETQSITLSDVPEGTKVYAPDGTLIGEVGADGSITIPLNDGMDAQYTGDEALRLDLPEGQTENFTIKATVTVTDTDAEDPSYSSDQAGVSTTYTETKEISVDISDSAPGNDVIAGGAGDDVIHGQQGDDTLSGDLGEGVEGTTGVITADNVLSSGAGFTVTARHDSSEEFSADRISIAGNRIGVVGATAVDAPEDQLGHNPVTGETEEMKIEFDNPVFTVRAGYSHLYQTESGGEVGTWTAYDAAGNVVGTGNFMAAERQNTGEVTITADSGCAISSVVFSAPAYEGGDPANQHDSSDYFLTTIEYDDFPSGSDTLYGEDGNDVLDGGSGADEVYGGEGLDTGIFTVGENTTFESGNTDTYDAYDGGEGVTEARGAGYDTLTVSYTAEDLQDPAVMADLLALRDFINEQTANGGEFNATGEGVTQTFDALGLIVANWEQVVFDGPPLIESSSSTLDEGLLDDGGPQTASGTFEYDYSQDEGGTADKGIKLTGIDKPVTSGGEPVDVVVSEDGTTVTGTNGEGETVFTMELNPETGEYTYTQNLPIDHEEGGATDDTLPIDFGVTITDSEGDSTAGTITINVTDEGPVAVDDSKTASVASDPETVSGNILSNDDPGADGLGQIQSITVDGVTYTYDPSGNSISGSDGSSTAGSSLSGLVTAAGATLTFDFATGDYDYTADPDTEIGTERFDYTIVDGDGDTSSATLELTVEDGGAQSPDLDLGNGPGNGPDAVSGAADGVEDTAIPLDISAGLNDIGGDNSETLSVEISGIPEGAVLKAGGTEITVTDGKAVLTGDQLGNLTITPPADSSTDFSLSVTATATEGDDTATTSGTLEVEVTPGADAPVLTITNADVTAVNEHAGDETLVGTKGEDTISGGGGDDNIDGLCGDDVLYGDTDTGMHTTALDFTAITGEQANADATGGVADGSEAITGYTITGLPEGAVLTNTAGDTIEIADGEATVAPDQLDGLQVSVPVGTANFELSVTANEIDVDENNPSQSDTASSATQTISVTVGDGDYGNDTIQGSAGDDEIHGQQGDDVLYGDQETGTGTTGVITADNVLSTDSGFTVTARHDSGSEFSAESIQVSGGKVGVVGSTAVDAPEDQLGHNPVTGDTEEIKVEFDNPVFTVRAGYSHLYQTESGGEVGTWTAYDTAGNVVGTGNFMAAEGQNTGEVTITADSGCAISSVVFSAPEYEGGDPANQHDSSDYFLTTIEYDDFPSGSDTLYGEDGNDVLDGGAGADEVYGGEGLDTGVFTVGENISGGVDVYDGGEGVTEARGAGYDTLTVSYTAEDLQDPAVVADLLALRDFINEQTAEGGQFNATGEGVSQTFSALGLTVSNWEEVVFDGPPLIESSSSTLDEGLLDDDGTQTASGTFEYDYGQDEGGTADKGIKLTGIDKPVTSGGEPVDVVVSEDGTTVTGTNGEGETVFTMELNPETGEYTYTQNLPIDHEEGGATDDTLPIDFGVTITDSEGDSTAGTITINVTDEGPVAVDDSKTASVASDPETVSGNILSNDDPGADGLGQIQSITVDGVTYTYDPSGNSISGSDGSSTAGSSLSGLVTAAGATLTFDFATGDYDYTAGPDTEIGTERFDYTIVDGDGDTSSATLELTVEDGGAQSPDLDLGNGPGNGPDAVSGAADGVEDTAIPLDISAGLNDIGGDNSETLSVEISGIPEGAVLKAGGTEITVTDGKAVLTGDQLGNLTITPPADSADDFQLSVTATATEVDGSTATTTGTLTVEVAPDADAP